MKIRDKAASFLPNPPFLWEKSEPPLFGKIWKTQSLFFMKEGEREVPTMPATLVAPLFHFFFSSNPLKFGFALFPSLIFLRNTKTGNNNDANEQSTHTQTHI